MSLIFPLFAKVTHLEWENYVLEFIESLYPDFPLILLTRDSMLGGRKEGLSATELWEGFSYSVDPAISSRWAELT